MLERSLVIRCENEFPRAFANVCERPYGLLFYNADNPHSHDSNHALILDTTHPAGHTLDDIIQFYRGRNLTPRVYQSFVPGLKEMLRDEFAKREFELVEWVDRYLVLAGSPAPAPDSGLVVRRIGRIDDGVAGIILSEDSGDWSVRALMRAVESENVHLLVGYHDGVPVAMANIMEFEHLSRIDNVLTHAAHRGRGHARTLIRQVIQYSEGIRRNPLYLCSSNETAIRIYEEAGFVDAGFELPFWVARPVARQTGIRA